MTSVFPNRPAAVPVTECPHCGVETPIAHFCGACGAHLAGEGNTATNRGHSYAAFPEESVLRLGVTTSLFPHLSHGSKVVFRAAVGIITVLLVALALAGVQAPVIAVAAFGIPILFVLYVVEIDESSDSSYLWPVTVLLFIGGGLGIGWGLIGGHYVNEALGPSLSFSLTDARSLAAAVVVPAVGVLLMVIPLTLFRWRGDRSAEALDGFIYGSACAMGFSLAATITQLSSLLAQGQFSDQPFTSVLTQAVVRGISSPLIASLTIALVGATIWTSRRSDLSANRTWLTSTLVALVITFCLEIGLGFCDIVQLSDAELILVHVSVVGLAIFGVRLCLHHILLLEQNVTTIGQPHACPHCLHLVPIMAFCPQCGVATRATAPRHRMRALVAFSARPESEGPLESPGESLTSDAVRWPTVASQAPGVPSTSAFPHVALSDRPDKLRFGKRRLFMTLGGGLALASAALIVVVVLVRPPPPLPCHLIYRCGGPSTNQRVQNGSLFTSSKYGFTLRYGDNSGVEKNPRGIVISYASSGGSEQGQIVVLGVLANGRSPVQLVSQAQRNFAVNAQVEYAVPNPFIGYQPASGVAYNAVVNGSSNLQLRERVIILAAVRNNLGIVVIDLGPYLKFTNSNSAVTGINSHPSPADQFAALVGDPVVNSVLWPNEAPPGAGT
jgi:RsiW-degrading membrane proteinase PrsW (M82 family)